MGTSNLFVGSGSPLNQAQATVNYSWDTTGVNSSTGGYTTTTTSIWTPNVQITTTTPMPEPEPILEVCDRFVARNRRAKHKVCKHCEQPYEDHAEYTREVLLKLREALT